VRAWVRARRAVGAGSGWLSFDENSRSCSRSPACRWSHTAPCGTAAAAVAAADELALSGRAQGDRPHARPQDRRRRGSRWACPTDARSPPRAAAMDTRLPALEGFLVQRQVARGVEALVGVTKDASPRAAPGRRDRRRRRRALQGRQLPGHAVSDSRLPPTCSTSYAAPGYSTAFAARPRPIGRRSSMCLQRISPPWSRSCPTGRARSQPGDRASSR